MIHKNTKEELKKTIIIDLMREYANYPRISKKDFLSKIETKHNVSNRTAIRYWNYIRLQEQQFETLQVLIDQLYFKSWDKEELSICSELLKLKFDILVSKLPTL
jgi:hypothetical protein